MYITVQKYLSECGIPMLLVLDSSQILINIEQHHLFFSTVVKFATSASGIHSKVRSGSKSYF